MGNGAAEGGLNVEFRTQPKLYGVIPEPKPACEKTQLKQEVNRHNYRENVWESVGSVKKETDSEGSGCPLGFGGDSTGTQE